MGMKQLPVFDHISKLISHNKLCHGRPRLTAYVLDHLFDKIPSLGPQHSLADAFIDLENVVYGRGIGVIVQFDEDELGSFTEICEERPFELVATEMFVDSLVTGQGLHRLSEGVPSLTKSARMIRKGLGSMRLDQSKRSYITLREPAVKEYLSVYLDFEKYTSAILSKISTNVQNAQVGDWFEYLVASAFIRKYGVPDEKIKKSTLSTLFYLERNERNCFYKPNAMCGPDILFKNENVLWIIQVRCVKTFYYPYRLNSAETLDPERFYTVRNRKSKYFGQPLKGYENHRNGILDTIQEKQLEIRKVVVASTRVRRQPDDTDVKWISADSNGDDFFEPINGDPKYVWKVMDDQCYSANDFEHPNVDDPDNYDY